MLCDIAREAVARCTHDCLARVEVFVDGVIGATEELTSLGEGSVEREIITCIGALAYFDSIRSQPLLCGAPRDVRRRETSLDFFPAEPHAIIGVGGVRNFQQSRLERSHAVSTQAELHADGRRAVDGGSADPSSWDRDGLFELEGSWGGEGAGRDEEGEEEEGFALHYENRG